MKMKHITLNRIYLVIIVLLSFSLAATLIYIQISRDKAAKSDGDLIANMQIDPDSFITDNTILPQDKVSDQIKIYGNPSIDVTDLENVAVNFYNDAGNSCFLIYEIVLTSTDRSVYKSQLIPPGSIIPTIKIDHINTSGEYNAVIKITTVSLDKKSTMNGSVIETKLIVKLDDGANVVDADALMETE